MAEKVKKTRWQAANVLELQSDSRRLWHFAAGANRLTLQREQELPPQTPLPPKYAGKDLSALWHRKLNVAWLPADDVFLRAVQLPASDFAEMLSMVEIQIEKLSPMPVHQIVWTVEILPKREDGMQTALVVIAARPAVEAFLGRLEQAGYLPDRLELPILDQLLATKVNDDGVWLYIPGTPGGPCLLAWWYGGVLHNVTLLALPPGLEAAPLLKEKIDQIAWAGELEGWLTKTPNWHLVADEETAATWQPLLSQWADGPVQVQAPLSRAELAAASAQRAARASPKVNLLPPDYSTRYRQQFVDRIWMGGVFSVIAVYGIGVLLYFVALTVLEHQLGSVQAEVRSMRQAYTNAVQMEARVKILEERRDLQFAALDSWKAIAELLPTDVTIEEISFGREKLTLRGNVPSESELQVTEFNQAMRRASIDGRPLFSHVSTHTGRHDQRTGMVNWGFECTLRGGAQ